jgi:hypothetical protein
MTDAIIRGAGPDDAVYHEERAKIYGGPKLPKPSTSGITGQLIMQKNHPRAQSHQSNGGDSQTGFLPKMPGLGGDNAAPITASHVNLVLDQMDRLRALMRDRELDLLKLRHENVVLKQVSILF